MTSSPVISTASSPLKSGSIAAQEKEPVEAEAAVETHVPKPALNKRRRDRNSKSKPKKRDTALCVGYYIDALDKKMLWGEAKIIRCKLKSQKIKVHFVGWSNNHDLWTDAMSITAHGRYAPRTKDNTVKSWDGDMHLFEDMLGTIDEAMFAPAAVPSEDKKQVALLTTSATKKTDKRKKATRARPTGLNRKANGGSSRKNIISKRIAAAPNVVEKKGHQRESDQRSKHVVAVAKAKAKESIIEKRKQPRNSKKQKREGQQCTASTTKNGGPSTKSGIASPDDLPLFRNLELDDGTVLDFSVQRETARMEREAMQSFLDKCSLVWMNELSVRSVR